jgi:hypothetical protein
MDEVTTDQLAPDQTGTDELTTTDYSDTPASADDSYTTTSEIDYSQLETAIGSEALDPAVGAAFTGGFLVMGAVYLAVLVLMIVSLWKIFTKAGRPGWASIIPIYNTYVMLQMVGRPGWWLLLLLVPFVNIVFAFILCVDLAKSFGRDAVYGIILLGFFSLIGYPMLAFGKDQYIGPSVGSSPQVPPVEPTAPAAA